MTIEDYVRMAIEKGAKCFRCKEPCQPESIQHYDHTWGWPVEGFDKLQWLFFVCKGESCHYETSFDKLGYRQLRPSERDRVSA